MWNGPGPGLGPRGGPPFRGDHRGEMFGRDRPMPDFRGRDGMNMGPMGHMGPRPHDLPPMDMRRMDGPPMRGRDMDPRDMRNREPNRDFFRPGDEPDFNQRRQYDAGDKRMNSGNFPGPGRNMADMGGRGGHPREPSGRFMDDRDRESLHFNMPQFHNDPGMDGRRFGFPPDGGDRKEFRNMHDRPPMGMGEPDRYNMDMPPRENRMMDFERRGGPPFNPRGSFDSDTDFRSRHGPSAEFSRRDRSPLRFGNRDAPTDRARSDSTSNAPGPQKSEFIGANDPLRERDFEDSADSPLSDYRGGEEMSLAEEWKNRQKEKKAFLDMGKNMGGPAEPNFSMGFSRDINVRDVPFQKSEKASLEFPAKEVGFPRPDHFPAMNLPPVSSEGPSLGPLDREKEKKRWLGEGNLQHSQNSLSHNERAPYHKEKNQPLLDTPMSADRLKDLAHGHGPARAKMGPHGDFESTAQVKDQDYRDIDYRTGAGRAFDYHHEVLPAPEKLIKDPKPIPHTRFSDSGPQDQDYRSALVEDKASNTISIIGIPKTATMEQILGAFADPSGVPMQGMKIKNVVPGYSYDTAYVDFLNLEDAVRFMESNKGSLKVGTRTTSMRYIQPDDCGRGFHEADEKAPLLQEPLLPPARDEHEPKTNADGSDAKGSVEPLSQSQWQRSSDLTPEAWQQQVDLQLKQQQSEQQDEPWASHGHHQHTSHRPESIFKDSKTMILKNVKATTSVDAILKALDPFAYLDERNVRLVKAKPPGAKCFCFVDMDSHEQVTRLVELLTKPKPLFIDGVRVYAEVAKPLKNPNFRRDGDGPNSSMLGYPPDGTMMGPPQFPPYPHYLPPPGGGPPGLQEGGHPVGPPDSGMEQAVGYGETAALDPSMHAGVAHMPMDPTSMSADASQSYVYGSEIPDMSSYLYDATSGFYYDPETTLYYDPSSRYFYNSQTQEYLYWDATSKTYIPVPAGTAIEGQAAPMTAEDQAILSNPAADAPLELKKPSALPQATELPAPAASSAAPEAVYTPAAASEKKDEDDASKKDREEKPKSLAAVKIMKDMERWAKIQNRQKDSVRAASPVLKGGLDDDRKQSKSADAGFAIFERKISGADDLFKKPLAPPKKDEKSKRPMGSLGMLASDYAAGSDEEVEEEREEPARSSKESQADKDSKLTDWKKMACLLCRRQFPNKDALIRHQQLSDLHKQNMEIHLKIKRSKKELEALENQEKELNARETPRSPEQKRRKQHHQQPQAHNSWAGGSRESHKVSERPGLGAEPVQPRKKKEHVVWTHATYKEAVRKAMFARFKELE